MLLKDNCIEFYYKYDCFHFMRLNDNILVGIQLCRNAIHVSQKMAHSTYIAIIDWTWQPPLIRQVMKTSTHFLLTNSNKHFTIKKAVKGSQTNILTPGKTFFIEHNLLSVNKSNSLLRLPICFLGFTTRTLVKWN